MRKLIVITVAAIMIAVIIKPWNWFPETIPTINTLVASEPSESQIQLLKEFEKHPDKIVCNVAFITAEHRNDTIKIANFEEVVLPDCLVAPARLFPVQGRRLLERIKTDRQHFKSLIPPFSSGVVDSIVSAKIVGDCYLRVIPELPTKD